MSGQRIVIIGGSFAGLSAVKALACSSVDILLLNRENYYTFSPLLHEVATGELAPELIAHSIRTMLKHMHNVQFMTADVKLVDVNNHVIQTDKDLISYDFLIIATGSNAHLISTPGASNYTFPVKKLQEAVNLRNQIISCLEKAVLEVNPSRQKQLLTFAIISGRTTGVELAASLREMIMALVPDYPTLDFSLSRVILLQAGDRFIPQFYQRSHVSRITSEALYLNDSTTIQSSTIIWAGGAVENVPMKTCGLSSIKNGQVPVLPTLQIAEHPQVYFVGYLASLPVMPMLGAVAIQQGKMAAMNLMRQIKGLKLLPMC
ncbi:NADH dehydrogenase [Richelia intracellularis]|nr:NADH dehydrogenase [Richelia intracellularis]